MLVAPGNLELIGSLERLTKPSSRVYVCALILYTIANAIWRISRFYAVDEIEKIITEYIEKEIVPGSAAMELVPDQNLLADGILDSVGLQSVISFVESRFEVQIGEDQLSPDNFATVEAICSLINTLKKT